MASRPQRAPNRYSAIIELIFFQHYVEGSADFHFSREEMVTAATELGIKLPKNIGDVLYSFRFRNPLPARILETQPAGMEWNIEQVRKARYRFILRRESRIRPREELVTVKIPDSTPEIISLYALDDEQALLAIVRYNRLIDIFLGITTYSLQNHLRTSHESRFQVEIDELYIGIDRVGRHYVIPVQAKGGTDQISQVQTRQDIEYCSHKFPGLRCRSISAQFMSDNRIALFELRIEEDEIRVVDERHYRLVPKIELDPDAIHAFDD